MGLLLKNGLDIAICFVLEHVGGLATFFLIFLIFKKNCL